MMDCLNKAEELARVVEDTRLLGDRPHRPGEISALLGQLESGGASRPSWP